MLDYFSPMRLRANIIGDGKTRHLVWDTTSAAAAPTERPATAEIVEIGGAIYLLRLNAASECVADTWHPDVAAAEAQAAFEYGIGDDGWEAVR